MLTMPPLAPKTLAALKELGICTLEDLHKISAVRAFLLLKASGLTVTKKHLVATGCVSFRSGCPAYFRGEKDGAGQDLEKPSACCRFSFAKRYGNLYAAGDRTGQTIGGIGRSPRWRGHRISRQGNRNGTQYLHWRPQCQPSCRNQCACRCRQSLTKLPFGRL